MQNGEWRYLFHLKIKSACLLQQIKDDLDSHSRPISSCLDQVRQIVATGGDVLSSDEVSTLEKNGRSLKTRYERAADRTDRLLKRLTSACDELNKFRFVLFCTQLICISWKMKLYICVLFLDS